MAVLVDGSRWDGLDEGLADNVLINSRCGKKALIARRFCAVLEDQYSHPVRIVVFNTAEGRSRDVTVDIADELRRRFAEYDDVPRSVQEFSETAVRR